jgi:hypothetical protein
MTARATAKIPEGHLSCRLCGGTFPRLVLAEMERCSLCPADLSAFAPPHYSSDVCTSGGRRAHANCIGRETHCTCDRCF